MSLQRNKPECKDNAVYKQGEIKRNFQIEIGGEEI